MIVVAFDVATWLVVCLLLVVVLFGFALWLAFGWVVW